MILIDSMMLIRRCYAKMGFLKNTKGINTGMEFGVLRSLEMLHKKYANHQIVICFDSPRSLRKEVNPEYKANRKREMPNDFYLRLNQFKRFLCEIYHTCECEGYEADDVMFTLSKNPGGHLIYTNDKDLLQAVKQNVVVLKSFMSKLYVWDSAKVIETFNVTPNLFGMYQAFIGDKIDNVIGIKRIPKKLLSDLISWAWKCNLPLKETLDEIITADWSHAMSEKVHDFVHSGQFTRNYEMVKLKLLAGLAIKEPGLDKIFITNKLNEWEIRTLQLCKGYACLENEEF